MFGVLAKFTVFPIRDTRIYFPNLIPPYLLLAGPFMALWASIRKGIASRSVALRSRR